MKQRKISLGRQGCLLTGRIRESETPDVAISANVDFRTRHKNRFNILVVKGFTDTSENPNIQSALGHETLHCHNSVGAVGGTERTSYLQSDAEIEYCETGR